MIQDLLKHKRVTCTSFIDILDLNVWIILFSKDAVIDLTHSLLCLGVGEDLFTDFGDCSFGIGELFSEINI